MFAQLIVWAIIVSTLVLHAITTYSTLNKLLIGAALFCL